MRFSTENTGSATADPTPSPSSTSLPINCQVSSWLICPLCTQIPGDNPVSAPCCSQLYCWECLVQVSQLECDCGKIVRPETCKPIDSTASRLLGEVIVRCKNQSCNQSVPRKLLDHHLNSCLETPTVCPISQQCTAVLVRREVESHCQTSCPYRTVVCSLGCGQEFALPEITEHAMVCPAIVVVCPAGCGFSSTRLSMISHQEQSCPFSLIHCTYFNAGCNEKFLRSQLEDHLQNNTRHHLDLVHQYSQAQAEQISVMNNQLQLVSSQLENLQSQTLATGGGSGCSGRNQCLAVNQLIQSIPAVSGVMEHAASLNCKQWVARAFFMVFLWWLLPTWIRFVMMFWVATHIFTKRVFPRIAHRESSVFFLNLIVFGLEFLLAVRLFG